jgi:hypothetical protein
MLEVRIKEHKYYLTQGLLKKIKISHEICWNEAKVLQIEPNTTYRKYKESAHVSAGPSDQSTQFGHLSHLHDMDYEESTDSVVCNCDHKEWFECGLITEETDTVKIMFLHPNGPSPSYTYPTR